MKFLGLIVVVAIVYFAYGKRLAPDGNPSINNAMSEFEKTVPANTRPAATSGTGTSAPASSGNASQPQGASSVRRPIDRTRAVLEQVKSRNGDGEF
jgi:hypothetical protein